MKKATTVTVRIDHAFTTLNSYINSERRNRYIGAKIKKDETQIAEEAFRGLEPILVPVRAIFTWTMKNKRKDLDNVAFAKKFILDGAVKAGFLQSDNCKYVVGLEDKLKYGEEEFVEVEFIHEMVEWFFRK